MKKFLRKFAWILPASLCVGLVMSLLEGGNFWVGWLAYSSILVIALGIIFQLYLSSSASRTLGLVLLLTIILRLGLGMAFSYILPPYGNDNEVQNAGYVYRDAYTRDTQSWNLAASTASLWSAFDRSTSTDQYGGMLFLDGALYRFLSPDMHRPWLMILVGALVAAIGVLLSWKAVRKLWGEPVAWGTAWILALYPEAVLLGSSQMREPYLMTFVAMVFWGVLDWSENRRSSAAWVAGGLVGMLLFNPGVAVAAILIIAIWLLLREKGNLVARRWWIGGAVMAVLLAIFIFIRAAGGSVLERGSLWDSLMNWFRLSSQWDAYLLQLNSGWVQNVFHILPAWLHPPFVIGYGIAQPVLPAAIADPGVWPMRALGIFRGLGWYALLPFLVYCLRPVWKMKAARERSAWLWLWVATWGWIILSAARAGGDQWDNPRYRVIFLLFQAALAAQTLSWQRATRDQWLGRFLAVEAVFLAFISYWYFARYTGWRAGQVHILIILALIVIVSAVILGLGWLSDRRRIRRS